MLRALNNSSWTSGPKLGNRVAKSNDMNGGLPRTREPQPIPGHYGMEGGWHDGEAAVDAIGVIKGKGYDAGNGRRVTVVNLETYGYCVCDTILGGGKADNQKLHLCADHDEADTYAKDYLAKVTTREPGSKGPTGGGSPLAAGQAAGRKEQSTVKQLGTGGGNTREPGSKGPTEAGSVQSDGQSAGRRSSTMQPDNLEVVQRSMGDWYGPNYRPLHKAGAKGVTAPGSRGGRFRVVNGRVVYGDKGNFHSPEHAAYSEYGAMQKPTTSQLLEHASKHFPDMGAGDHQQQSEGHSDARYYHRSIAMTEKDKDLGAMGRMMGHENAGNYHEAVANAAQPEYKGHPHPGTVLDKGEVKSMLRHHKEMSAHHEAVSKELAGRYDYTAQRHKETAQTYAMVHDRIKAAAEQMEKEKGEGMTSYGRTIHGTDHPNYKNLPSDPQKAAEHVLKKYKDYSGQEHHEASRLHRFATDGQSKLTGGDAGLRLRIAEAHKMAGHQLINAEMDRLREAQAQVDSGKPVKKSVVLGYDTEPLFESWDLLYKAEDVHAPGSHGGKYHVTKSGKIVYGPEHPSYNEHQTSREFDAKHKDWSAADHDDAYNKHMEPVREAWKSPANNGDKPELKGHYNAAQMHVAGYGHANFRENHGEEADERWGDKAPAHHAQMFSMVGGKQVAHPHNATHYDQKYMHSGPDEEHKEEAIVKLRRATPNFKIADHKRAGDKHQKLAGEAFKAANRNHNDPTYKAHLKAARLHDAAADQMRDEPTGQAEIAKTKETQQKKYAKDAETKHAEGSIGKTDSGKNIPAAEHKSYDGGSFWNTHFQHFSPQDHKDAADKHVAEGTAAFQRFNDADDKDAVLKKVMAHAHAAQKHMIWHGAAK